MRFSTKFFFVILAYRQKGFDCFRLLVSCGEKASKSIFLCRKGNTNYEQSNEGTAYFCNRIGLFIDIEKFGNNMHKEFSIYDLMHKI